VYLAALHQLLLGRLVPIGRGGVLGGGDGLSGGRCRLLGCILTGNRHAATLSTRRPIEQRLSAGHHTPLKHVRVHLRGKDSRSFSEPELHVEEAPLMQHRQVKLIHFPHRPEEYHGG